MRKCFLHIGTHKTGTTAIQIQLNNNRPRLAEYGFFYPKIGIPSPFAGHHNIAWELCGDRRFKPNLGTVDDLFSELDKSDRNVILSSEDFECATDNLGSFIAGLEHRDFEVEVIIYFRDQASYLRTLYLGLTSHQQYPRTYGEYLSEVMEYRAIRWREWVYMFDYRALLSRLPPATRIVARPFRPQSSVVGDFVSILGLTPLDLNMDPDFRANAQEPISLAVAGLYRSRTGRNVRKYYKQTMREISRTFDNGKVDLGIASRRRLIDAFESSNRWMNERYEIPMPAGAERDTVGPAPSSNFWLDLEAVFSSATLRLIDTLCEAESRRSWSILWDPRRWLRGWK
jgi:hypothetical protein